MGPDFICIGAQRAGTTWVYNCLREHPQIFLPDKKELQYFNANDQRDLQWYENQFKDASSGQTIGEITPNYLSVPNALERIAAYKPSIKIIVVLREPLSRTVSAHQLFEGRRYSGLSLSEACHQHEFLIRQSLYFESLAQLFSLFNRRQVHVALYDELVARPEEFLQKLFQFLDVDETIKPSALSKKFNKMIFPGLQRILVKFHLNWLIEAVKKTPLRGVILNLVTKTNDKSHAKKELVEYKQRFLEDAVKLEELLQFDLSAWKREIERL